MKIQNKGSTDHPSPCKKKQKKEDVEERIQNMDNKLNYLGQRKRRNSLASATTWSLPSRGTKCDPSNLGEITSSTKPDCAKMWLDESTSPGQIVFLAGHDRLHVHGVLSLHACHGNVLSFSPSKSSKITMDCSKKNPGSRELGSFDLGTRDILVIHFIV